MSKTTTRTLTKLLTTLLVLTLITPKPTESSLDTFVYGGCSQIKYAPNSAYESNLNSLLTSIVNSATFNSYNKFTISLQGVTVYGLYQCRGDLSSGDCGNCVARAVTQIGNLCSQSSGAALQLDGCLVKYDNNTFLGVEDKTVVVKKCGPSMGYGPDVLSRRDALLDYLGAAGGAGGPYKYYRVGGSGPLYGAAQCTQDLSVSQCQDCLADTIQRLKTDCGASGRGDVYLAKCYTRFTIAGYHSSSNNGSNSNDEEIQKTLAILVGLIAGVAVLVVFLSIISKAIEKGKGRK